MTLKNKFKFLSLSNLNYYEIKELDQREKSSSEPINLNFSKSSCSSSSSKKINYEYREFLKRPRGFNKTFKHNKDLIYTNLERVLELIGSFGLYQKFQFLLVGFLAIIPSMVSYSYVFASATPKFTCKVVREINFINYKNSDMFVNNDLIEESSDDPFRNFKAEKSEYILETRKFIRLLTDEQISKNTIDFDGNCQLDPIIIYRKKINNSLNLLGTKRINQNNQKSNYKCVEWVYDKSVYGETTVTDWNLVCLRGHLKAMTQNAYILGTGCSVFTGILSDKVGRKKTLIFMITLMVLVLNITQFFMHSAVLSINQKFIIFTISRFFQGIAQTMYSIGFVLLLEITCPKNRVTAGNILAYSFSLGQIIIATLAYYFKNWLKIYWALAIYVIPFFTYFFLVPESPRWLLSVDKVRSARRVIFKIFHFNNQFKTMDVEKGQLNLDETSKEYIFGLLQEESNRLLENKKNTSFKKTFYGIIKSPILVKRFFILFYIWMAILAVYSGISMGISGNLDRYLNPYLVVIIAAIFEFLSIVTCHLVLNKFGRKYTLIVFMIISSVTIYLIPIYFKTFPAVSICLYFLAKYSIGGAQLACMIFTSELYPTPMRSTGVGLSFAFARLGGVWSPQINFLSSTLGSIYVPFVIFSIASLLASILCLYLPETLNKKLPENVHEAKAIKQ